MHDSKYPGQIERMFDAMLCLPRTAWGLLLREVEKKIGADALHKIIVRVFEETDRRKLEEFKRAVAVINREKRKQKEQGLKKKNARQLGRVSSLAWNGLTPQADVFTAGNGSHKFRRSPHQFHRFDNAHTTRYTMPSTIQAAVRIATPK